MGENAVKDFLIENLRGMCAFRDPDRRECHQQPARTIRDYCTPCLAAERLALPASASPHPHGEVNDIRLMTDFQIVKVLEARASHDANGDTGRWVMKLLTAWVTDSPLSALDAIAAERAASNGGSHD